MWGPCHRLSRRQPSSATLHCDRRKEQACGRGAEDSSAETEQGGGRKRDRRGAGKAFQSSTCRRRAAADSGRATLDPSQFRRVGTPFYWYTNCACGSFWKEKGEFDRALADCNEVIRLDPGYAAAYANRGDVWRLKGDLDQALNDHDQAIRLSPESIVFYIHRGDLLRYKGDLKRALAAYDQALRLDAD